MQTWRIQARVLEKGILNSFQRKTGEGKIFSAVVVDKDGTAINIKFWGNLAETWHPQLELGSVYNMSKGRIVVANKKYSGSIDHDYEICFDRECEIQPVEPAEQAEAAIPEERQHLYQTLRSVNLSTKSLPFVADILAVVHSYQSTREAPSKQNIAETRKRRVITVVDATRFALDVTLWGQEADVDDSILDAHPVVALTNIQIREWRGRAASTYSTTRIRWNPDLPATTELAEWYSQNSASAVFEPMSNIAGEGGTQRGLTQTKDMTISEISADLALQPTDSNTTYKVVCYISGILYKNPAQDKALNLIYMACVKCNRKLSSDSLNHCSNCNDATTASPKVSVTLLLCDSSASGFSVRAFNDAAQALFNMSSARISEHSKAFESGGEIPVELLETLEYNCLWKRYTISIRGRREVYQNDVRSNFAVISIVPASTNLVASIAMQACLKVVPSIFDSNPAQTKRVCIVDAEDRISGQKKAKLSTDE